MKKHGRLGSQNEGATRSGLGSSTEVPISRPSGEKEAEQPGQTNTYQRGAKPEVRRTRIGTGRLKNRTTNRVRQCPPVTVVHDDDQSLHHLGKAWEEEEEEGRLGQSRESNDNLAIMTDETRRATYSNPGLQTSPHERPAPAEPGLTLSLPILLKSQLGYLACVGHRSGGSGRRRRGIGGRRKFKRDHRGTGIHKALRCGRPADVDVGEKGDDLQGRSREVKRRKNRKVGCPS